MKIDVVNAIHDEASSEASGRQRRSADLPKTLDLRFSLGERNVSLGLTRNTAMEDLPPVYTVRGNSLERLMPGLTKPR